MKWRQGLFVFLFFFITGCASLGTYNPATGQREFIFISTPEEVSMGKNIHDGIERQYEFTDDPQLRHRIEDIGMRIAQVSDRQDLPYEFFVIEKDDLNAFTTPGGRVYVFTGLIDKLKTDDQIAFVLAHEIAHGAARHTVKKFQAALGYDLLQALIFSQLDLSYNTQQIARLSSNTVMQIVFSSYGRKDEYQADSLGIRYMDLAGYDVDQAVGAMEVLLEEEKEGLQTPLFLRTHPYVEDRIERIREEIALLKSDPDEYYFKNPE